MPYTRVTLKDGSGNAGGDTPISATNLNVMDAGIQTLDTTTPKVGPNSTVTYTISAGNGAPTTLAANEIYIQLT